MSRKLAIWLSWHNFSEYYSRQLAQAIESDYETTITYNALDWKKFDVVMPFFPHCRPGCDPGKIVKCLWEPHEFGMVKPGTRVILASSTSVYERIEPKYGDRVRLVRWGVNLDHFWPQPFPETEAIRVGWAGLRDNPRKQFPALKECVESIGDQVKFQPNEAWMTQGKVHGKYTLKTIWRYYAQIHVYACGSASEGFGFPLLEASACGRPVVTFDVGVARDLQATGAGIVIVDSYEEMKEAIRRVDYRRLGAKSAEAVRQRWLWPHLRNRWLEVLAAAG